MRTTVVLLLAEGIGYGMRGILARTHPGGTAHLFAYYAGIDVARLVPESADSQLEEHEEVREPVAA